MHRHDYPCVSTLRRTLFLAFCALIWLCSGEFCFGSGPSSLTVGTASMAGTTATVPLSFVSGSGNSAGLEWTVSVQGATAISVEAGPTANSAGKAIHCNGNTCLVAGLNANTIPSGVIATLSVVLPPAASGAFAVQLSDVAESLADGTPEDIVSQNGIIVVGNSPVAAMPSGLQCSPATLSSGQASSCSLTLSSVAPSTGATISLSSSSSQVSVPAAVAVAGNSSSATFTAKAGSIHTDEVATITASLDGASRNTALALIADVSLSSVRCADAAIFSKSSTTCTVSLTAPAVNDTFVTLSAQDSLLTVPAAVSIPAGFITQSFLVSAGTTSASESAILTASLANQVSTAFAITVLAPPVFQLQGNSSEVKGLSNGAVVIPSTAPAGFTGTLVMNGTGSVEFSPVEAGNGVYFLNCCANNGNAYYKFTGASVGSIFNAAQGQISFYVRSRYSFAQRRSSARLPRYAFDVRDGNNTHLFGFLTQVETDSAGTHLMFTYIAGGSGSSYFVPAGMEDQVFGDGVILKVTMSWDGKKSNLYLNDTLAESAPYLIPTPNWSAASNFDLGAYEYLTFGGYNSSDDVIEGFTVATGTSAIASSAISNPGAPPVISDVDATSITSSEGTINWTTDKNSYSQVAYGVTPSYESLTALNLALVTSHSVTLTGLQPATTYHYQAQSLDAEGNLTTSADATFTTETAPAGPLLLFQLHGDGSELSGGTNGSIVTPSIGPAGFTGNVVVNGTGSVNLAAAESGNGVYFLNCCTNYNNAYYRFAGTSVGQIFGVSQGQVSFYVTSRHSFAEREASANLPRFAFDVRDGNNNHLFMFLTEIVTNASGTYLDFSYRAGGSGDYYFVPAGTEDTLFGEGVTLKVTITWDNNASKLYLNDRLVKSAPNSQSKPNWTSSSVFDLGAYEYETVGYNTSDDIIGQFTVSSGPAQ